MVSPSEELLAIREKCAAEWEPGEWFRGQTMGVMGYKAWCYLERLVFWPYSWLCSDCRTRLEVVEMIERAAVAALKDEGRL